MRYRCPAVTQLKLFCPESLDKGFAMWVFKTFICDFELQFEEKAAYLAYFSFSASYFEINDFRFIDELQIWYRMFLYSLHPAYSNVNILHITTCINQN